MQIDRHDTEALRNLVLVKVVRRSQLRNAGVAVEIRSKMHVCAWRLWDVQCRCASRDTEIYAAFLINVPPVSISLFFNFATTLSSHHRHHQRGLSLLLRLSSISSPLLGLCVSSLPSGVGMGRNPPPATTALCKFALPRFRYVLPVKEETGLPVPVASIIMPLSFIPMTLSMLPRSTPTYRITHPLPFAPFHSFVAYPFP